MKKEKSKGRENSIPITEIQGPIGVVDECSLRQRYQELTRLLIEKECTITSMESCTSGLLASLITDEEGSSMIFKGSFVAYSNEAKVLMGVPCEIIAQYGVYSAETAVAMAEVSRSAFQTDIAVGVTGTFGNADPSNADSTPGEVFFAIASEKGISCFHCVVPEQPTRLAYKLYMASIIRDALKKTLR